MGRRWGKTVLGGALAISAANAGAKVAWVVPSYRNGRPLWRWAEATVSPLRRSGLVSVNRSERMIEFPSGGFLGIYSMDSEDSIRGEAFHLVIVDEAAAIAETAWTDAIQPTLADYAGDAVLISTPKGRNWFWQEWIRGQDGGSVVASFVAPSAANPNPRIQAAAEMARSRVPERTYRQEWLAEFLEDGGGVFRRVRDAATAEPVEREDGHQYVIGVDWAQMADFSVFSVIDVTTRRQVALDRFNQIDYGIQRGRLWALWERYGKPPVIAESNSIGLPIIEQLTHDGMSVAPFVTTNATKAQVVDGLALAFEQGALAILADPVQLAELEAFEAERLPSGLLRYRAPQGSHDDTVMALCLAWYGASQPPAAEVSSDPEPAAWERRRRADMFGRGAR